MLCIHVLDLSDFCGILYYDFSIILINKCPTIIRELDKCMFLLGYYIHKQIAFSYVCKIQNSTNVQRFVQIETCLCIKYIRFILY